MHFSFARAYVEYALLLILVAIITLLVLLTMGHTIVNLFISH